MLPIDRPDEFYGIMDRLKLGESAPLHDTERVTKDGRRIFVSASVSPIKNAQDK